MIQRKHYIDQVRPFYDSDLIKIITGIRRCGKTVIMEQIIKEIAEKTDNIIYLNFEDKKVFANISNVEKLLSYVEDNKKMENVICFLTKYKCLMVGKTLVKH